MGDVSLTERLGNLAAFWSMYPCTGIGGSTSVDPISPVLEGPKLDANKKLKTKQEAATTADLSQQEPHLEVVDMMPSVASSDEERLAVAISTIGLQTKRLSGAQRKRLTQERKMREGPGWKRSLQEKLLQLRVRMGQGVVGV